MLEESSSERPGAELRSSPRDASPAPGGDPHALESPSLDRSGLGSPTKGDGIDTNGAAMWDENLPEQQRAAAGAPQQHNVLLAGPGMGKTFVLVRRVQYLVEEKNLDPATITALTFTRAAAAEMRQRLEERLGSAGSQVRVSTLHSYALRELLSHQGNSSVARPVRIVDDWEESNIIVAELSRLMGISPTEVGDKLGLLETNWARLSDQAEGRPADPPDPVLVSQLEQLQSVYGSTLRMELIYRLLQTLRSDPTFQPSTPTSEVLVDEYQDLNLCDLQTIKMLAERAGANVFAAGDDDQSIYSFRSAHPVGIRRFTTDYPDAEELHLTECMRCGDDAIALANWVIQQDPDRVAKTLVSVRDTPTSVHLVRPRDQDEEARVVSELIHQQVTGHNVAAEQILVLFKSDRNGKNSKLLIEALERSSVDVYLPRSRSEAEEEIERLMQYMELGESLDARGVIDDLALRSLLQLEDNGLGITRMFGVTKVAIEHGCHFSEAIELLRSGEADYPSTGLQKLLDSVDDILAIAKEVRQLEEEGFTEWLNRACQHLQLSDEATQELQAALAPTLAEFADTDNPDAVALNFAQALRDAVTRIGPSLPTSEPGKVTITTMHGAKGLTADYVYVMQAEEEILPGDVNKLDDINEQRRLLYVSLTRARRKLYITACSRRTGAAQYTGAAAGPTRELTRYLKDYGLEARTSAEALNIDRAEGP